MNLRTSHPFDELQNLLGDRFSTSQSVREQHGKGESWHPVQPPDAVCFAKTTEEVASIVRWCNQHKVPVIAFGTGTSLEGQVQAVNGGICIDLSQMDQVLEVNQEDLDCRVEAGVTRRSLNHYLRDTGLFSVDPGADTSIGGMAATRLPAPMPCVMAPCGKTYRFNRGHGQWRDHQNRFTGASHRRVMT